jgi:adenylosuccinate synthase
LSSARSLVIVGLQWGDEGKGKIVDFVADDYAGIVRFNGGSNAGHTVVTGRDRHTFHLLPSGALKRKRLLIGPGVALDPLVLSEELELLQKERVKLDLLVDGRCTTVSPLEKEMDAWLEGTRGEKALGTTRRGIGPSYAMRALRLTPRAMDIFAKDFDFDAAPSFYRRLGTRPIDQKAWLAKARSILKGRLGDVSESVREIMEAGKRVLFEGSQGSLLDLYHGTYPYVTSSHTIATYAAASLGIAPDRVDPLGVMKCYTTRVGAGPFPTEIEGSLAEEIRRVGREYGATTGRPRRVGWVDIPALKYAVKINGVGEIVVSKVDVLSKVKRLRACVGYTFNGSAMPGFYDALPVLRHVEPEYIELDSFFGLELNAKRLPRAVEKFLEFLEDSLHVSVKFVSYGEDRSRTIER